MNLPWSVVDLTGNWHVEKCGFPWGITDCWGVVIGRFDTENQAKQAVDSVNEFFEVHSA